MVCFFIVCALLSSPVYQQHPQHPLSNQLLSVSQPLLSAALLSTEGFMFAGMDGWFGGVRELDHRWI